MVLSLRSRARAERAACQCPPGHPLGPRGRNGLLLPHEGRIRDVLGGPSAEGPRLSCDPRAPGP
eukprot:5825010-Alexandrium_andersonii.AAC.1